MNEYYREICHWMGHHSDELWCLLACTPFILYVSAILYFGYKDDVRRKYLKLFNKEKYLAEKKAKEKAERDEKRRITMQYRRAYKAKHGVWPPRGYNFEKDPDYMYTDYYTDFCIAEDRKNGLDDGNDEKDYDMSTSGYYRGKIDDTSTVNTSSHHSWFNSSDDKEDVDKAYRDGMNDGLWGDSFRYDSNNKGRTERERQAYEQGYLDHADEEDF